MDTHCNTLLSCGPICYQLDSTLHGEPACAKAINEHNSVVNKSIDRIAHEAANTTIIMSTVPSIQLPIGRVGALGGMVMGGLHGGGTITMVSSSQWRNYLTTGPTARFSKRPPPSLIIRVTSLNLIVIIKS